jgi:hypothetical protein
MRDGEERVLGPRKTEVGVFSVLLGSFGGGEREFPGSRFIIILGRDREGIRGFSGSCSFFIVLKYRVGF